MTAFYWHDPKIDVLSKVVSGGHNEKWIHARFNVSKQMEVVMGNLTAEEVLTDRNGEIHHSPTLPLFEHHLFPSISNIQTVWWDECNIEQRGGKLSTRCISTVFDATRMANYAKTANTRRIYSRK